MTTVMADNGSYVQNCSLLDYVNRTLIEFETCNLTASFSDEEPPQSNLQTAFHIILQTFYGLVCVFGVFGNSLVIHVVTKYSKMQTVTNFYILNLAVADILYLSMLPFLLVTSELKSWIFGNLTCKVYWMISSINQFTSSFFLTIMSADRYIAVCHPLSAQKYRTSILSRLASLSAWALASLMIVPVFMYSTALEFQSRVRCIIYWPTSLTFNGHILFTYYSLILSYALPFLFIFIFYSLVTLKLKELGRKSNSAQRKKSSRKVTRLVLTLVIVYGLSYLPYWSLQVHLTLLPSDHQSHSPTMVKLYYLSSCISYANSAMNPLLYAFISDNFNKSFKRACSCYPFLSGGNDDLQKTRSRRKSKSHKGRRPTSETSTKYRGTVVEDTGANFGTYCETSLVSPSKLPKKIDNDETKPPNLFNYPKTTQL